MTTQEELDWELRRRRLRDARVFGEVKDFQTGKYRPRNWKKESIFTGEGFADIDLPHDWVKEEMLTSDGIQIVTHPRGMRRDPFTGEWHY